jgi:hypothetical protein
VSNHRKNKAIWKTFYILAAAQTQESCSLRVCSRVTIAQSHLQPLGYCRAGEGDSALWNGAVVVVVGGGGCEGQWRRRHDRGGEDGDPISKVAKPAPGSPVGGSKAGRVRRRAGARQGGERTRAPEGTDCNAGWLTGPPSPRAGGWPRGIRTTTRPRRGRARPSARFYCCIDIVVQRVKVDNEP